MKSVNCLCYGSRMKRNGGGVRRQAEMEVRLLWDVQDGALDDSAARIEEFLGWLPSKGTQLEMPGGGRTFRRRTSEFWAIWPMPVPDGEWHRVLYVDGIWLAERLVLLICCSRERVASWYMAESESARAWSALMAPVPAPDVVVADGGSGFASVVRKTWPRTRVQRCVFHAFCQVRRYTMNRPGLQAGRGLYGLALDLRTSGPSTRPSCGSSATWTGAASGPTSWMAPASSTAGESTPIVDVHLKVVRMVTKN